MTRPTRIAIAALSVLLAGSIALLVWMYVSDRAAAAEWALRDQAHQIEVDKLVARARLAAQESAKRLEEANGLKAERDELAEELAASKAKRRTQPMPKTLRGCTDQLADAEGEIALHERHAALDLLTIEALRGALEEQTIRGDLFEEAWTRERDRANGWREYSRKDKRRQRVKIAFTAIGAGAVAGLAGYGIGAAR